MNSRFEYLVEQYFNPSKTPFTFHTDEFPAEFWIVRKPEEGDTPESICVKTDIVNVSNDAKNFGTVFGIYCREQVARQAARHLFS